MAKVQIKSEKVTPFGGIFHELTVGTGTCPHDCDIREKKKCYSRGYAIARCQAKTTLKSYWHELRDHQEYSKKIAMKTGTHTQVPLPHDYEILRRCLQPSYIFSNIPRPLHP